jgi:hypothetical protein
LEVGREKEEGWEVELKIFTPTDVLLPSFVIRHWF